MSSDSTRSAPDVKTLLTPEHLRYLTSAAIAHAVLARVRAQSVLTMAHLPPGLEQWGAQATPGILFRHESPSGRLSYQLRPDTPIPITDDDGQPTGKARKYLIGRGESSMLDVVIAPSSPDDLVWIVEGTKQRLAAASYARAGVAVYGIDGCSNWSTGRVPIRDLDVVLARHVVVWFDTDVWTNLQVRRAAYKLRDELERRGARSVRYAQVPRAKGSAGKDGVDDWLARLPEAERADALDAACRAARELPDGPRAERERRAQEEQEQERRTAERELAATPVEIEAPEELAPWSVEWCPPVIRDLSMAVERNCGAPAIVTAITCLTVVATLVQHRCRVRMPYGSEPLSLYSIITMPSGSAKSPATKYALAPLIDWLIRLQRTVDDRAKRIAAEKRELQERIKEHRKKRPTPRMQGHPDKYQDLATWEAELRVMLEQEARLEPPHAPTLLVGDSNPEMLPKVLGDNASSVWGAGSAGIIDSEGAFIANLLGRHTNHRNLEALLKGYSGDQLVWSRSSRNSDVPQSALIASCHLSLCMVVQPVVLEDLLESPRISDTGLTGRLLVLPLGAPRNPELRSPSVPTHLVENWAQCVSRLAQSMLPEAHERPPEEIDLSEETVWDEMWVNVCRAVDEQGLPWSTAKRLLPRLGRLLSLCEVVDWACGDSVTVPQGPSVPQTVGGDFGARASREVRDLRISHLDTYLNTHPRAYTRVNTQLIAHLTNIDRPTDSLGHLTARLTHLLARHHRQLEDSDDTGGRLGILRSKCIYVRRPSEGGGVTPASGVGAMVTRRSISRALNVSAGDAEAAAQELVQAGVLERMGAQRRHDMAMWRVVRMPATQREPGED